MAKCVSCLAFDPDSPPCELVGWPQLDGLCVEHFRAFRIEPAYIVFREAETKWMAMRDRLFYVEVAMGERPPLPLSLRVQTKKAMFSRLRKAISLEEDCLDDNDE